MDYILFNIFPYFPNKIAIRRVRSSINVVDFQSDPEVKQATDASFAQLSFKQNASIPNASEKIEERIYFFLSRGNITPIGLAQAIFS